MTSEHALNAKPTDYRLRRFKVIYIVIVITIILATSISVALYNSRRICGETVMPGGGREICAPATYWGRGTSLGIIVVEAGIAIIGYFFLPRLYRYLTPPQGKQ
jgi:hypothetical protein